MLSNRSEIEGTAVGEQNHNTGNETNVTDTIHHKCLHSRTGWRRTLLIGFGAFIDPEADQQIGTQADQLPTDKDDQEVPCEHDH